MASFASEWAQLKHETSAGDGMQLAGTGGTPGWDKSASGGVKSGKNAWNTAGDGVGLLGGNVKQALTALEQGQKGTGAQGVHSAAAQREVYQSWKRYLDGMAAGAPRSRSAWRRRATTSTRATSRSWKPSTR
ncbi:hypothetical protein ACFQ2B_06235 [Streptomyces stramineus]